MKRARCKSCFYLNWNWITDTRDMNPPYFCGLHGRAIVDPDGEQENLDHNGGCGYSPKETSYQLSLFEDY